MIECMVMELPLIESKKGAKRSLFLLDKKLTFIRTLENLIACQKYLHNLVVLEKNTNRDNYTLGGLR